MDKNKKKGTPELRVAVELLIARYLDEAAPIFIAALAANPQDPDANFYYGQLLCEQNNFIEAEPHLKLCLKSEPNNADYLAALAFAIHKQGRLPDAHGYYNQALGIDPQNALLLRNLGILRLDQGQFAESRDLLKRSAERNPADSKTQNCLGLALQNTNDLASAAGALGAAIDIAPTYASAYVNLVAVLERLNRLTEAQKALDKGKAACSDTNLFGYYEAVLLRRQGNLQAAAAILESQDYPQDPMTVAHALNDLARIYDLMEQTDKAFAQFQKFNDFATQAFDINPEAKAEYRNGVDACQKVFTQKFVKTWRPFTPDDTRADPTFLFGFSRSGTTLLQHILGAHPSIHTTEEVPAVAKVVDSIRQTIGNYPDCLATLDHQLCNDFRQLYFTIHEAQPEWEDKPILVDKNPLMTPMIGAAQRFFPDSKILFVLRHPCDCVLSSYMHFSYPNNPTLFLYDLDDAVALYCQLMDLWDQYQRVLPLNVHTVRYEDIVSDFRTSVGATFDFLGTPWDDAVLKYHERASNHANIRTPSYDQVSQKIYDHACYRWQRYRKYLEPYLDRLAPYAERIGYDL